MFYSNISRSFIMLGFYLCSTCPKGTLNFLQNVSFDQYQEINTDTLSYIINELLGNIITNHPVKPVSTIPLSQPDANAKPKDH